MAQSNIIDLPQRLLESNNLPFSRALCFMFAQMCWEDGEVIQMWNWLFLGEFYNA